MNHNNNQKVLVMKKEINAMVARQKFGELLDHAYHRDNQFVITRANKPMAAIISFNAYQQFLKQRENDFTVLDRVWTKVPKVSEAKTETDISAAISDVRNAKNPLPLEQKRDL